MMVYFLIDESTADGLISVLNTCRKKIPDGSLNSARGLPLDLMRMNKEN